MAQRRSWTEEEDRVLRHLRDTLQVKKWSQISRRLDFQYNVPGRNGKQCRERYTNHLDSSIISKEFTLDEQEKLFQLHDKIGNKWSHISKQFNGRTDNHIKNHFHSKLRKAIRKLNKQIKLNFKKTVKPYKLTLIYKIVEASDFRLLERIAFAQEDLKFFNDLKNQLLQYAGGLVEKTQISEMKDRDQAFYLIKRLQTFDKCFKLSKPIALAQFTKKPLNTKAPKSTKRNDSTSNSQCQSNMEIQDCAEQSQEQSSIYQEMSFQFINQINQGNNSLKSMEDQITDSTQSEKEHKNDYEAKLESIQGKKFYSFQNNQKQQSGQALKKQNILISLIEQTEFPDVNLNRKMSIKSFESLREYEDSCLNDSQVYMMLKRFDSYSNIEAGLFE